MSILNNVTGNVTRIVEELQKPKPKRPSVIISRTWDLPNESVAKAKKIDEIKTESDRRTFAQNIRAGEQGAPKKDLTNPFAALKVYGTDELAAGNTPDQLKEKTRRDFLNKQRQRQKKSGGAGTGRDATILSKAADGMNGNKSLLSGL